MPHLNKIRDAPKRKFKCSYSGDRKWPSVQWENNLKTQTCENFVQSGIFFQPFICSLKFSKTEPFVVTKVSLQKNASLPFCVHV